MTDTLTPKDILLNHLEYTFAKEAWQADLEALHEVSRAIRGKAKSSDLDALLQPFPGEDLGPGVLRVLRMATHDIYHAGQIRYLRALQGV